MILVEADSSEEWDGDKDWAELARGAALAAVTNSTYFALAGSGLEAEVSVRFTGDEEVRALNAAWRNKDQATNVLSFPMFEGELSEQVAGKDAGEILLGDVVLAYGVCAAEARARGISICDHAAHLVVHGTLHLLGYDHERGEQEADRMEQAEREALAALGVADPYMSEVQS